MKVKLFVILSLFSFSSMSSQIISFSKDSLNIRWHHDGFYGSDTTWVFNRGESDLIIDSILTKNMYGYRIYSSSFPSGYSYVVGFDKPPINLNITVGDSVELIVADPDLCPICKGASIQVFFTDTLTFVSNSITGRYYVIDVRGDGPSSVNEETIIPHEIKLFQNYPNPFNPATTIRYTIPITETRHPAKAGQVASSIQNIRLKVYDILGREITTLVNGRKSFGDFEVRFDGSELPSGVYFYQLETNGFVLTRKMLLLR